MPLLFYHIGGLYSNVRWNANKIPKRVDEIANHLFDPKVKLDSKDDEPLQFFMGITPCGASYVLLSKPVVDASWHLRGLVGSGRPWSSDEFVSLSPIHFANAHALAATLTLLENKKRKKKGEAPRDRSQANVSFTTGSELGTLQSAGIDRANFEYQRVFNLMSRGIIDGAQYDTKRVSWFNDVQTVWAFAYNNWNADQRALAERRRDPKVLDVGWTEFIPPASSPEIFALKTNHLVMKENSLLNNRTPCETFLHGDTEEATHSEISERLQAIFQDAKKSKPVVLLVHNITWAIVVLRFFGVDTSSWCIGIEPIIGRKVLERSMCGEPWHSADYDDRNRGRKNQSMKQAYDQRFKSSRSRSPGRGRDTRHRARSPERSPYTVYVVDIQALYFAMKQVPLEDRHTVSSMAADLRINLRQPDAPSEPNTGLLPTLPGWCAGNESRLLGYIWFTMANGNAIDEQRLERFDRIVQRTHENAETMQQKAPAPAPAAAAAEDSDSDRDPNDMVPTSGPSGGRDPYATDSDEEIW